MTFTNLFIGSLTPFTSLSNEGRFNCAAIILGVDRENARKGTSSSLCNDHVVDHISREMLDVTKILQAAEGFAKEKQVVIYR